MPPDADISLIRRAFRRKAKSCHPDLFQQVSEEEHKRQQKIFVRLSQAYEVLADPAKRKILDRQLGNTGKKTTLPSDQKNKTSSSSSSKSGYNQESGFHRNFQKSTFLESDGSLEDLLRDAEKMLGQFGLNFKDPLEIFVDWARQIFKEVTESIGDQDDFRTNLASSNQKTQANSHSYKDPVHNIEAELNRLKKQQEKVISRSSFSVHSKLIDIEIEQELRSIKKKYKL